MPTILAEARGLSKDFPVKGKKGALLHGVSQVDLPVYEGETLALVGESGCGKSTLGRLLLGLIPPTEGQVLFDGQDLAQCAPKELRALRRQMQMVFQDTAAALNPRWDVGEILAEPLRIHKLCPPGEYTARAEALLERVGLPRHLLGRYPHELSGGQRQRVLIAMALTRDPKLVIADEPTTALDVTVQKQVIDLLNKLQHELGFAMVFVSHDLALVAEVANSITVMYAGQVVEQGPVKEILTNPIHEYTRGLLGSVLSIEAGGARLHQVPGSVPSPKDFPEGDRFRPRSSHPDKTSNVRPMLKRVANSDHYYAELPDSELKRIGVKPYLTGGAN